jgi:hypothetical protein
VVKISRKETPSKLEPHKQQIMAAVKVTDDRQGHFFTESVM